MGNQREDLTGRQFGRLMVVGLDRSVPRKVGRGYRQFWLCRCNCGGEKVVLADNLKAGRTISCDCVRDENRVKHGDYKSFEYKIWLQMRDRCRNQNNKHFAAYGGRGIMVCDRWNDYANFISDMGRRPSDDHSIERERNDDGYQPDNCVWATKREQAYNKRSNKLSLEKAAQD